MVDDDADCGEEIGGLLEENLPHLRWSVTELADLLLGLDPDLVEDEVAGWSRDELTQGLFAVLDKRGEERLSEEAVRRFWGFSGSDEEWEATFGYISRGLHVAKEGMTFEQFKAMINGDWAEPIFDDDGESLKRLVIDADIALIKVRYLRDLANRGRPLQARCFIPEDAMVRGEAVADLQLETQKGDVQAPKRRLFVVSHAWLSEEHPDPSGSRLRELMTTLRKIHAHSEELVFIDYSSLHQVDRNHPDVRAGKELPPGHPALRTEWQEQKFREAQASMDVLYGSAVSHVIILKKIHALKGNDTAQYTKIEHKYLKRLWCRLELSVAAMFRRIANEEAMPDLPKNRTPEAIMKMVEFGEMVLSNPADKPLLEEMYKRYYFASVQPDLIQYVRRGEALWHLSGISAALSALHLPLRHGLLLELGLHRTLAPFAVDVVRLMMDWQSVEAAAKALRMSSGDASLLDALREVAADQDWRSRLSAVCALDVADPVEPTAAAAARRQCLRSLRRDWQMLAIALDEVRRTSDRTNERSILVLAALVEDPDGDVRKLAVSALISVAGLGHPCAVSSLERTAALARDWRAQLAVLGALDAVGSDSSSPSAECRKLIAEALLGPRDVKAAVASLRRLADVAPTADGRTVDFCRAVLSIPEHVARLEALRTLVQVVPPEDERALESLGAALRDRHAAVRTEAVEVLSKCKRGDARAAAALLKALEDGEWCIRCRTTQVLGTLVERGDAQVMKVLLSVLKNDDHEYVRMEAAKALGQLRLDDDDALAGELAERLAVDEHPVVREALVDVVRHAVPVLGHGSDAAAAVAIKAILPLIHDPAPRVRRRAAPAVAALAERGAAGVVEALVAGLSDEDEAARQAVVQALHRVAARGDRQVLEALRLRLEDESASVRFFTVLALTELSGRFEQALELGQRVEINGLMSSRSRGAQGTIARFDDDRNPAVLMDNGTLKVFNNREVTVLSEGMLASLVKLESDPHAGVRKAVASAMTQRRNALKSETRLGWLDMKNPKHNPTCTKSGRIPPSWRKAPSPNPEENELPVPGPRMRAKCGMDPIWLPVRPHSSQSFSPSAYIYSLPNSPEAAPDLWARPRSPGQPDGMPRRPQTVPAGCRGHGIEDGGRASKTPSPCSLPRPQSEGASPFYGAAMRPPSVGRARQRPANRHLFASGGRKPPRLQSPELGEAAGGRVHSARAKTPF